MAMMKFGFGQPLTRKEDDALLRGAGRYVADVAPAGALHAVVLRSPHAHANFKVTDLAAAKAMKGVRLILTGDDITDLGPMPTPGVLEGVDIDVPFYPVLALGVVRHVGDAVAFVVADTLDQAKDAADAIAIDWQPLPHVIGSLAALEKGAPQVWPDRPNLSFETTEGDEAATKAAFAKAARTVKTTIVNQRLVTNYMDTRGVVAEYDGDRYTLTLGSQGSHIIRDIICGDVLRQPLDKMRVITPDVGGGFGTKLFPYREYALAAVAAEKLRKPVKWVCDRSEHFLGDSHGRDNISTATIALDENNKFLALELDIVADMGAYLSCYAPYIPWLGVGMATGVYDIPAAFIRLRAAYTNTVPVDAYRGAGRPEASFLIERMMETSARQLKVDPAELRRKNFVSTFPHQTPVIMAYDIGDFNASLDAALKAIDYAGFPARKAEAKKNGKLRGLGFSCYIEACGIAPSKAVGSLGAGVGLWESAEIRVNPVGTVEVLTGSHSHGQGHETTFCQLIAERLGVPIDQVSVIHGDTDKVQFGMGTYGSRSLAVGGSAIVKAMEKIEAKAKKIAAHQMEASEADIVIENGELKVAGTDKAMAFANVALAAYTAHNLPDGMEPGLKESAFYDPSNFTFPAGTYICELEVDSDTGKTEFVNFVAADDFGRLINPMIVEGQVHGGLTQGIGQALLEGAVYDANGQLVTASFMDYAMPRADDVPSYQLQHTTTLCPGNPLGVKGCGEAGAIGASAAVINAITDAIGNNNLTMPATPDRVWHAIHGQA